MLHRTIEDRLEEIENEVHDIKTMLLQHLTLKSIKQPDIKDDAYMSVKEVAAFAGVDTPIVYAACTKGQIQFIKIGKLYKFKKEDVIKWLNSEKTTVNSPEVNIDRYVEKYLQDHELHG